MKVISELIEYFVGRGALSRDQLAQLHRLGFYAEAELEHDEPPPLHADDLTDEEDRYRIAPVRRPKGKGGHAPKAANLSEDALQSRLAERLAESAEALQALHPLARRIDLQVTVDGAPMAIRNASDDELLAALRRSFETRDPPIDRLWDAISDSGYREIAGQGPVARAYQAILKSDDHTERGQHAWLLRHPNVRRAYNLARAQRRLTAAAGRLYREDPELMRRAIARDYHEIAWLAYLILYNAPRRKPALRLELKGHTGAVRGLAMTPDGKSLVSAGEDGTVRAWDLASGSHTVLVRNRAAVESVAIHGSTLAAGDREGTILHGGIDGSLPVSSWVAGLHPIRAVAFDPTGGILASADAQGLVRLWNPLTHAPRAVLGGHPQAVTQLACSRDFLLSMDGVHALLWSADLSRWLGEIPAFLPRSAAFHPDGRRAVIGCDTALSIWNLPACECQRAAENLGGCLAISWSPSGETIAAGTRRGVLFFDEHLKPAGEFSWTSPIVFVEHTLDGAVVAIASNGLVLIWKHPRIDNLEMVSPNLGFTAAAFSRSRSLLAVANAVGWIRIWDISGSPRQSCLFERDGPSVAAMAFDWEGQSLYAADRNGEVRAWNLESKTQSPPVKDKEKHLPIRCMGFNRAGELILAGSGQRGIGFIASIDVTTRSLIRRVCGSAGEILTLAFHPRESSLVAGGENALIYIWDWAAHSCIGVWEGPMAIRSLQFDPQGDSIAAAGPSHAFALRFPEWEGQPFFSSGDEHAIALLIDGVVASAGKDGVVRFWSAADGTQAGSLPGHRGPVFALASSADGQMLASAGSDSTIRVWDILQGLRGHDEIYPEPERIQWANWKPWITAWEQALRMAPAEVPPYLALVCTGSPDAFSEERFGWLGQHLWRIPFFRPRK